MHRSERCAAGTRALILYELRLVFSLRGAFGVGALGDFGRGLAEPARGDVERLGGFGFATWRGEEALGARNFAERAQVLAVTSDTESSQLAQIRGDAGRALQGSEQGRFRRIGRVP